MKNKIKLIFLLTGFLLAACSAKYETYYEYKEPASESANICVQQCQLSKNRCQKMCTNDDSLCQKNALMQAQLEYKKYINQQLTAGTTASRDLNSFYDPLQCAKTSCDCQQDYKACFQLCGGIIKVKQRCIANCQ